MRKRILSILLALCMVLTLMPQAAFAEGETESTPSLSAFATKDQLMNSFSSNDFDNKGKLVFGKNSEGKAQEWYILGKDGGVSGDNTMIFAADSIAKSLPFRSDLNVIPYDKSWGCEYSTNSVKEVAANHYGASDLRKSLQNIAKNNNYFSSAEQGMMNATRIENWDYYGDKISVPYYTTDILYALDSNPFTLGNYVLYNIGSERKALNDEYLWINGKYFWMREVEAMYDGCAYVTYYPHRTMYLYPVNAKYDARPAGNLNLSDVLFASAATTTSLSTAKSGIIASGTAMTLRLDGSSKDIGRAVYDITTGDIKAVKGSTSGNVALVVQGNDGTRDWYYSQKITGTQTLKTSTIKSALGLSGNIDLSSCRIWLETTAGDGMLYAVTANGCSTEAEMRNAINAGVTSISLACDIDLSNTLNLSDKNITLDLNGHTLKGNITLADTSAAPKSILTLIDSNPAKGGVVNGRITLTRGSNGTASHLYANGGTVTGQVSMPSYAGGIYCTSSTPTVFKGYVGNYGEIHGGIFYSNINEGCIKEKTVTFMNGSSRYALEVVTSGNKAVAPAEPAKDGYVFVGWYNGDTKYDFTKPLTENITLSAKWVSENVSTKDQLNEAVALGSTFIRLTNNITLSDILNLSDKVLTLDLNGHTLEGDIKLADTSAAPKSILTLIDSDPAKGGILKGNITLTRGSYGTASHLYANGGTVTGMVSMPSYVGGIYCTSSTPTVFKGYVGNYGGIYGGIFYSNINEGCIKERTVTFMNGSSQYALEVVASGSKLAEPITPSVKTGYQSFDGWYDGDTKYTFGSPISDNLTLTAKFGDPITYNIKYDLGEGGTATNPETYTVESEAITLTNPVKEGYIFTGWSGTGLTGENNMTVTIPKGSTGAREYTAHYMAKNNYSVVFDTNGGTAINGRTDVKWTDKVLENITDPTREGYTFSGWKCGDTSVGADTTYAILAVNENVSEIELTAQWEAKNYTVSFDTNGGTAINSRTDVKWTDKVLEGIIDPTREGYTFIGWKCGDTEVDETTNYSDLAVNDTVSSIELTAQWIENIVPAAPTGTISIDGHSWDSFNSNITFDRFFKTTKTVEITASESGTVTIEYLLSDRALTVDELDEAVFTKYDEAFSLDLNHEYVIYARLTDASGYVTYINSGGIVIDTVPPVISGIENGSTYCSSHKVTVTEKYIKSVTVNEAEVELDDQNQFDLTMQVGEKRIAATDWADNQSEMTVTVRGGHEDADTDHICDYCGTNVSVHKDNDNDHLCDICGVTLAENTGGGGGVYVPPSQSPIVKNDDNATTSADLSDTTSTSGGTTTANIDKAIGEEIVDKAVENKSEEVVIDATANTSAAAGSTVIAQVGIPTATLEAIAEKTEADVTVKTDVAEVKMDNAAAGAVAEQAAGDTVQIIVEKVDETADKVEFQLKVVCSQGNVISDFKGGNVAVTVEIPKNMASKEIVCVYIDDDGRMSKVKGQKNADGTYTFTTGHFSTYALMTEEEADTAIAAQKEEIIAKLDSYALVARSMACKTSSGKKAIRIRVYDKNGLSADFFDGIEIYRSTKKNTGYGKKPIFVTKSGKSSYYNTAVKKGTKYYYRVRGFVIIDGQKYYTDYSLKAIRTAK